MPDTSSDYDLDDDALTVSELSNALKNHVEQNFNCIKLRAEISSLKIHTSGHAYFCLKDNDCIIDGICWRGALQKIPLKLEDGIEVICIGRITTYPARSKYQMVVQTIKLHGTGSLLKALEDRKRRLAAEGLFDAERKQVLPFLPQKIGVITSLTGSVIRDILHRIADRFPLHVIIWPTLVQGEGASDQITNAINGFNSLPNDHALKPDVIIVARGGGSIEDLWCFNEENVVRATAASLLPIISAIGHETDTTLIDYAADYRAPTPTGAAELVVPMKTDLEYNIKTLGNRLSAGLSRLIFEYAQRCDDRTSRFHYAQHNYLSLKVNRVRAFRIISPQMLLEKKQQQLEATVQVFHKAPIKLIENLCWKLTHLNKLMDAYSHEKVLARGFCLVQDKYSNLIVKKDQINQQDILSLKFSDGACRVVAI